MPLQSNVNVSVRYAAESTFGTAASAAGGQRLRRVSSTLALAKDAFTSNEVRSDQQVFDARHGTRRVQGQLQGELSTQTFDDFLEAVMRGTWTAGVSASNTQFTSLTVSGSAFQIGGGSWITQGFKVGDVIRLSGFTHANVAKNFRITALTATAATVTPSPAAMTSQATFSVAVQGKKLLNGSGIRSFTFEQNYPDIDISELYTGCRIGEMAIQLPPSGIATVSTTIVGQNGQNLASPNAPYFTNPGAETTTGVLAGVNGSLVVDGAASAVITGLDFSINCNLSSTPVVGANTVPDVFYGRSVITGNVSAYLESESLLNVFTDEEEIDIIAQIDAAGAAPADFLCFRFHRVKFTGISKTVGPDGGVVASFPFQALLRTGGAGTVYDQSTAVIQRSNA